MFKYKIKWESNSQISFIQVLYDDRCLSKTLNVNSFKESLNNLVEKYKEITNEFVICHTYEHITFNDDMIRSIKCILDVMKIHNCLDKFKIIDNNINKIFDEKFDNWRFIYNVYKPQPLMIGEFHEYIKKTKNEIFDEKIKGNFKKRFLSFNSYPKHHRKMLYNFLIESNIDKQTYLSYKVGLKNDPERTLIEDDSFNTNVHNNLNISPLHHKSFCNIVTESKWEVPNKFHLTEKTDKCFVTLQPFIILSTAYYLKTLKELGFKTFDKWWDESYDLEEDNDLRLKKIFETIRYVSKLTERDVKKIYIDMKDTLYHNFNLSEKIWTGTGKKYWFPKADYLEKKMGFEEIEI